MPLDEREYHLPDVADTLLGKMEEVAETEAAFDVDTEGAKQAAQQGNQYRQQRAGVLWALGWPDKENRTGARWDAESVTFGALKNGELRMVTDIAEEKGMSTVDLYVAVGTTDAPYLKHEPYNKRKDEVIETALAIADLHPHFADWAESKISDLGGMGAEGNSYRRLVLEKRASQSSQK